MAIRTEKLSAWFGDHQVLKDITLTANENEVLALIGPSGCGKSTYLRCLNRLHEETPQAYSKGQIFVGEESGYGVLNGCSLVTTPYTANGQIVGVLGVVGPTRMAYQRVIPLVDVTAKLLGAALNQD